MITAGHIGGRVRDGAGRIGILRDVIVDYEDPAELPWSRRRRATAFPGPECGGREWLVPLDAVVPGPSPGPVSRPGPGT